MAPKLSSEDMTAQLVGSDALHLGFTDGPETKMATPRTASTRVCYTALELRGIPAKLGDEELCHGEAEAHELRNVMAIGKLQASKSKRLETNASEGRQEVKSKRGKLQGGRTDCLQCDRRAFWELDFCAPCLTMEAKFWDGVPRTRERTTKDHPAEARLPKTQPLSAAEVQELQGFPSDTCSSCVGNRGSMKIMNSMLTDHGRQSHNPIIRQYGQRSHNYDAASESLECAGHRHDCGERSDRTSSVWSETRNQDGGARTEHDYMHTHQAAPRSRKSRRSVGASSAHAETPRSLSFRDHVRSAVRFMIGQQRESPPASSAYIDSSDERELFPGRVQPRQLQVKISGIKREGSRDDDSAWEECDERTNYPNRSAKKVKTEPDNELMGLEEHAADRYTKVDTESRRAPANGWEFDVLENMLQMEISTRPAPPREVGLAVKKEMEKRLIEDIVYGNPDDGRPIYIPLLRALNKALECES